MAQSSVFSATVLLLVFCAAAELTVCQNFTIVPSNESTCPEEVCYTLDQLAENFFVISPDDSFDENSTVTLDLLPGNHTLNLPLLVQNITQFEMRGNNASFTLNAFLFHFERIKFLYFSRVNFIINSRALNVREVSEFVVEDCGFESNERLQIYSTSNVLIDNATFARSSNTILDFSRSAVIIKDSLFADSNVVNASIFQGLIHTSGSSLTIENCDFVNNFVYSDKIFPGIITTSLSSERLSIVNSTFHNNSNRAGIIQASFFDSVIISGCTFTNNIVDSGSSAVSVSGENVNITETMFSNNTVTDIVGRTLEIRAYHGSIRNCSFVKNNSTGGTASLRLLESNSSFVIEQNRFTNNDNGGRGNGNGGGLSVNGDSCNMLTLRQNTFLNNSARSGGALDLSIGRNCRTILIKKNNFTSNHADTITSDGGAVYYRESSLLGTSSESFSDVVIVDNVFVNNSAFSCGSAIYSTRSTFSNQDDTPQQTYRLRLDSNVFYTSREFKSSLLCLQYGNITITNGNFSRNSDLRGGALHLTNTVTTIANSTFRFNYASREGGAIYASGSHVTITNSILENNQAASGGGAISIDRGVLMVTNTSFANNSAGEGRGDNILACSSEVILSNDTLFSGHQNPFDSECFFPNKALSDSSFFSLAIFIAFTTMSLITNLY